jgi:hypothetical protein
LLRLCPYRLFSILLKDLALDSSECPICQLSLNNNSATFHLLICCPGTENARTHFVNSTADSDYRVGCLSTLLGCEKPGSLKTSSSFISSIYFLFNSITKTTSGTSRSISSSHDSEASDSS